MPAQLKPCTLHFQEKVVCVPVCCIALLLCQHVGCRAVTEAKNEVMERKKDLDITKEKMDKLVEKLYLGRSVIPFIQLACPLIHHACPLIHHAPLCTMLPHLSGRLVGPSCTTPRQPPPLVHVVFQRPHRLHCLCENALINPQLLAQTSAARTSAPCLSGQHHSTIWHSLDHTIRHVIRMCGIPDRFDKNVLAAMSAGRRV